MGQRMFVAVVPPDSVREDLEAFLDARPGLRWSHPHQWHVTLAFFASVPEHRIDELGDRLATKASKRHTVTTALAGEVRSPTRPGPACCGSDSTAARRS